MATSTTEPIIIQGGMGVGVSSWQLARAVAATGQLGVVSGTALAVTVARRLADGDPGGHLQRVLTGFPIPEIAERVLARYLDARAPRSGERYGRVPRPSLAPSRAELELTVVANYAEVALAREGHDGPVGVNHLTKIALPTLASLYGNLLAGVDVVLMGAGIPAAIPAVLDRLAAHEDAELRIEVVGGEPATSRFSPRALLAGAPAPTLTRPRFVAIVSSHTLATYLDRSASGAPDGYVVELPTAGGHNAPPRGRGALGADGQPVYGPRDVVRIDAIAALGRPFWLAGGYGSPERLAEAQAAGAAGVQVGTAFALCQESGLDPALRERVLAEVRAGTVRVRTDPVASPTGFPFKLVELSGTVADPVTAEARPRRCDLGYLRELVRREDGGIDARCAAEPVAHYVRKGGREQDTVGRRCLCNGLLASNGLGQRGPDGRQEPALVTAGDDLGELRRLPDGYGARDVVDHLLAGVG